MPRRSDARVRMVDAGADLFGRHGLRATMLEVADHAAAPRGSIYHHFPKGKDDLIAAGASKLHRDLAGSVTAAAALHDDPVAFLQHLVDDHGARVATADYQRGCPLIGLVASGGLESSDVANVARNLVAAWSAAIAEALESKGFDAPRAEQLATLLVALVEGCNVVARGARSTAAFAGLRDSIPALVDPPR